MLKHHADLLSLLRCNVSPDRANKALADAIKSIKNIQSRRLVRANATRWSSFYKSLKSIFHLKEAIILMFGRDRAKVGKKRLFNPEQLENVSLGT